jgi:hypothetical protein
MSEVRPAHYRGLTADGIELQAADIGEAFGLNHHLSTAVEYLIRAGKKPGAAAAIDKAKAKWWIDRDTDCEAAKHGTEPADGPVECEDDYEPRPGSTAARTDTVIAAVQYELLKATFKHPPIRSAHEGYAIIAEELEELWAEIKRQKPDREVMRREAGQVAAMAIRFLRDLLLDDES